MDWQPIETAPKDGTRILLFRPTASSWGRVIFGRYDDDRYAVVPKPFWTTDLHRLEGKRHERSTIPTHWAPIPGEPQS